MAPWGWLVSAIMSGASAGKTQCLGELESPGGVLAQILVFGACYWLESQLAVDQKPSAHSLCLQVSVAHGLGIHIMVGANNSVYVHARDLDLQQSPCTEGRFPKNKISTLKMAKQRDGKNKNN